MTRPLEKTELNALAQQCFQKAEKASASGRSLKKALADCEQALEYRPDYAEAHNLRGLILDALGNNEEAILAYQEAIRLQPDFTDAKENLEDAEAENRNAQPKNGNKSEEDISGILEDLKSDDLTVVRSGTESIRENRIADQRVIEALQTIASSDPNYYARKDAQRTLTALGIDYEFNERGRGFWLSAYLVLTIVVSSINLILVLWSIISIYRNFIDYQQVLIALSELASIRFAIAIWNWKKWGVYGVVGVIVLNMLLALLQGGSIEGAVLRAISAIAILALIIRPKWTQMD